MEGRLTGGEGDQGKHVERDGRSSSPMTARVRSRPSFHAMRVHRGRPSASQRRAIDRVDTGRVEKSALDVLLGLRYHP